MWYFILIIVRAKENTSITHLNIGERKIPAVTAIQRLNSGSIHVYFYYASFAGNCNNCHIKGLEEIIIIEISISVLNKKKI